MPRIKATLVLDYNDEFLEPADGNTAEQVEDTLRELLHDADLDADDVYCVEID